MANSILVVEEKITRWLECGEELSENDIKYLSTLLGQPTRKNDVLLTRYNDVFRKLVQKNCVEIDNNTSICIYSWNPRAYVRYFPVALHATGTILLFKKNCRVELVAWPIHRSMDPEVKGVELPLDEKPVEVTKRVDGWQITAYYDKVLDKWMLATRYVLHNMYYERGRLHIENYGEIVNPYVEVADYVARRDGLYDVLKGFEGWTFTFVLEGPEPAIIRPPQPILIEEYMDKYRLLLVAARKPGGELLTTSESGSILGWRTVEVVKTDKTIRELLEDAKHMLDTRSLMVRLAGDKETPLLYELKSEVYPDVMRFIHNYDAKSYMLLATRGISDEVLEIIKDDEVREKARRLEEQVLEVRSVLEELISKSPDKLREYVLSKPELRPLVRDLGKIAETRAYDRVAKKMLALVLTDKSIYEAENIVKELLSDLRNLSS